MKRLTTVLCTLVLFAFAMPFASAADINLFDYAFNVDGAISEGSFGDPLPAELNAAGFDFTIGLGTLSFTISGAGAHSVITFLDHEIDEPINTWFNENGTATGTPAAGQSWEIDEPGFVFGDIYANFLAGSLDNTNGVPAGLEEDVSMALGWDFSLAAGETATIDFITSTTMPAGGFYLFQQDPESADPETIYFSSTLDISGGGGPEPIPEPGTWILMLTGLALTGGIAAKRSGKRK